MQTTWLIDTNVFSDDEQVGVFREEITRCGSHIIECDFPAMMMEDHILRVSDGPLIPYGSINMVKYCQKFRDVFSWCEWDRLTCTSYLSQLAPYSIHHKYAYLTFKELLHKADFVCDTFSDGYFVFVRPNGNDKLFHGQVVHVNNYLEWWGDHKRNWKVDDEALCMVSTPSTLTHEYRLWFAGCEYIAGSTYGDEKEGVPDELVKFATDALSCSSFYPFPLFTVDLCLTDDGLPHIMEVGSVNCAGLYKAAVGPIVTHMERQATLEWEDLYGQKTK